MRRPREEPCEVCGARDVIFADFCGAWVCDSCEAHQGLARCYCGWAAGGGDGRAELIEMGETIEEEL